ncbi:MAG TPA: MFS transporter [Anaeromyxobacteraceae bacterium]|nr:MFS transporter [Anaeromyxobacteraceae bacterium]
MYEVTAPIARPPPVPPPRPGPAYRWLVLLACSLAMFGNYYVFDALPPVTPLLEQAFGFTGKQVGSLDTAYNVAALLTLLAGGVLIDRLGTARSAVIFAAIGAVGTGLIALLPAVIPQAPWAGMMVGRFVLGVGSESFIVAATTVVGRWFKGKEISFALAMQLVLARFGQYAADWSPNLESLFTSWQPPLLVAAAVGGVWLLFAVVYAGLETNAARRWGSDEVAPTDKLSLAGLLRYDRAYWWVVGLCVAFYATIFPFRTFTNLFLTDFHGISNDQAGSLKSVLPLFSMIGMPIFGIVADRFGRRALLMTVGSALLVPPFLLMVHTGLPLQLSMAMLGIAFALVPAVLWPAVTYLVPGARLGSAYALMTFCQQVAWAAVSPGIGEVKDLAGASAANPSGWVPVMWMLAALALAGFVFSFLLWREERGPRAHGLETRKA